jgi:hypothetical protein
VKARWAAVTLFAILWTQLHGNPAFGYGAAGVGQNSKFTRVNGFLLPRGCHEDGIRSSEYETLKFRSRDGYAIFEFSMDGKGSTIAELKKNFSMSNARQKNGTVFTFRAYHGSWYAVSGHTSFGSIIYEVSTPAHNMTIIYPRQQKTAYDAIVNAMVSDFVKNNVSFPPGESRPPAPVHKTEMVSNPRQSVTSKPLFTVDQAKQLSVGMTYEQVCGVMGAAGSYMGGLNGHEGPPGHPVKPFKVYNWSRMADGIRGNVRVEFRDGQASYIKANNFQTGNFDLGTSMDYR